MIALLLVLLCLTSLSSALITPGQVAGRCNGLPLQNALIAAARALNPPCTITFHNASTEENNCDWSFDLVSARVLTDVELKAHSLALKAVIAADIKLLGLINIDLALGLSIEGNASPYKCQTTVVCPPTIGNILTNLVSGVVGLLPDLRLTLPLEFLLTVPSGVVNCGQPIVIGAEVHLGIQLTYLRALTQAEIDAHALKIKALVAARVQPDLSKVLVVVRKTVGLLGLFHHYDCGCVIKPSE